MTLQNGRFFQARIWPVFAWALASLPAGYAAAALFKSLVISATLYVHLRNLVEMAGIVFVLGGPFAFGSVWLIRRERFVRPWGDLVMGALSGAAVFWLLTFIVIGSGGFHLFSLGAYTAALTLVPPLAGAASGMTYWLCAGRPRPPYAR